MILGSVDSHLHPRIPVEIDGPSPRTVEAVVDTGFDGDLTLPRELVEELGLVSAGERKGTLADGSEITFSVYDATVTWHEGSRRIRVIAVDGMTLAGMALLRGTELHIEVVPDGEVRVEPM